MTSGMDRSDASRLFFCGFRCVIYIPRTGVLGMSPTFIGSNRPVVLFFLF
jgi:hypothetical protein